MPSPDIALDLTIGQVPPPREPFTNAKAWAHGDVSPADWEVELDGAVLKELDAIVTSLRQQTLPTYMLHPTQFEMAATGACMQDARWRAFEGIGFAVIDRLPLDDWSIDETKAVIWLIVQHVSSPVAQTSAGEIFRDVKDAMEPGQIPAHEELAFHTDNSGNRNLPDLSTLTCVHPAGQGGLSEYCTVYSLYNAMLEEAPEQLDRLFQPFLHDRLDIQVPGEPAVSWAPAIGYDGERLLSRFSLNKIRGGYRKAGRELDGAGLEALETALAVIRGCELSARCALERGQMLIFNNREGLHHRGPFTNGETEDSQRHLIRVWLRDEGRPFFDG